MLDFSLSAGFPASFRPAEAQLAAAPGLPFSEQLLALWQQSQPPTMPTPEQVVASWGEPNPQPFFSQAAAAPAPTPASQPVALGHFPALSLEVKPAEATLEPIALARAPVFQAAPTPVPQPAADPVVVPLAPAAAPAPTDFQRLPSELQAEVQPSLAGLPVVVQLPPINPPVQTRVGAVETVLEPIATLPVGPKEQPPLVLAGPPAFEPSAPESLTLVAVEQQPSWAPRALTPELTTASPDEPAKEAPSQAQPEPDEEPAGHRVVPAWQPETTRLEEEPEQAKEPDQELAAALPVPLPLPKPRTEVEPVTPGPQPSQDRPVTAGPEPSQDQPDTPGPQPTQAPPQNLDVHPSRPPHAPAAAPEHVKAERPELFAQPAPSEAGLAQAAPRPAPEPAPANPRPERVVPLPVFASAPQPQPAPIDELVPLYSARPPASPTAAPQPAPALKPSLAPIQADQPAPRLVVASGPEPAARPQPPLPNSRPRATVAQIPAAAFLTPRLVPIQVQAMPPTGPEPANRTVEPTTRAIEPVTPAQPSMVSMTDSPPAPVFEPALRLQFAAMTTIAKPSGRQAQDLSASMQLPASAFLTPRPFPMQPQPVPSSQPFSPPALPDQDAEARLVSELDGPTTRVQPAPARAIAPVPQPKVAPGPQEPPAQPASQTPPQTRPAPTTAPVPLDVPTVVIPPQAQPAPQPEPEPAAVSQEPDQPLAPATPRPRLVMMEQPATSAAPPPTPTPTEARPSRLPRVFEPALPVKTSPKVVPEEEKHELAPELELAPASPTRSEGPELPRPTVPVASVGRFLAREIPQHKHGHFEIELDPDRLGRLRIELKASDDGKKIEGVLHVSADHARDALESQMPELRKALASQGIELRTQVVADPYGHGVAADSKGEGRQQRQQSQPASAGPDLATDETPVANDPARRGLYA